MFAFILLYFLDLLSLQCQHPLPWSESELTIREHLLPGTKVPSGNLPSQELWDEELSMLRGSGMKCIPCCSSLTQLKHNCGGESRGQCSSFVFIACRHAYAGRAGYYDGKSVRPSVRLTHSGIVLKLMHVSPSSFHHLAEARLLIFLSATAITKF